MRNDPDILGPNGDLRPGLYRLLESDDTALAKSPFMPYTKTVTVIVSNGWAVFFDGPSFAWECNTAFAAEHFLFRPLYAGELKHVILFGSDTEQTLNSPVDLEEASSEPQP